VIVISNEDALAKEDKEKLDAAREKVFDLEFLSLLPSLTRYQPL